MTTHATHFRRLVAMLAWVGLDPAPLASRVRNAILRPYREAAAVRFDALGAAQARLHSELASLQDGMRSGQATAEALAGEAARHAASLRDCLDLLGELRSQVARDDDARQHIEGRLSDLTGELSVATAALSAATAERAELHERCLLLEELLCGVAAARPPGAAAAVAHLPRPAVSVILPVFNRAALLGEAVASVQAQSFRDWELVIVDDGSTDATQSVVQSLVAEDPRIRGLRQRKTNAATARNLGIAQSAAPLIAYLDSDNVWYPEFLQRAVDCLATESDVDLIYGALATWHHALDRRCILWQPYDRAALVAANMIDTNVVVHRRDLVARYGGWDGALDRLADWDLILRYTQAKPARRLPVLAACYRRCDTQSITDLVPVGPADAAVRGKWFPPPQPARRPRVLHLFWQYPQLSETYAETELLRMQQWGVHVEVWRSSQGPSPYPTGVAIHDGTLQEAIAAARPDIIHVQWLSFAHAQAATLAACGLPVTLRLHGFDVTRDSLRAWLRNDWVSAVFAYPHQIAASGLADARLKPMPVAFDTSLFRPHSNKDPRLVVRTAAALASKDLELFCEAAKRLPDFRFVLAGVTCHDREAYVGYLRGLKERTGSPVELMFDVPRQATAALVGAAGIYLHTMHPPGQASATPVGQPISIAEAMATGCYCLVRDVPALADYVGDAGATYRDLDGVLDLVAATRDWGEAKWRQTRRDAIDRAFLGHADVTVLRVLFDEWMQLAAASVQPASAAPG